MIICIKNFHRNDLANLTIRSIRHFIPDVRICVLCLCKENPYEYSGLSPLTIFPEDIFFSKTKYYGLGPSVANPCNNLFFSEGYNLIYQRLKNEKDKLLMICEDHFFTNGHTLAELYDSSFDVAYAPWAAGANGSILCVNLEEETTHKAFPIPEDRTTVEHVLRGWIDAHFKKSHRLSTRSELDYKNDGFYSNDYNEIKSAVDRLTNIE